MEQYLDKEAIILFESLNLNKVDSDVLELIIRNAHQNGYQKGYNEAMSKAKELIDNQFKVK